jgi:glycosyltransferase involved in cell wall biosynthesis
LIIVHSHLRWDFVWQRPQQILSRLAAWHRVVFVEEAVYAAEAHEPCLEITQPLPRVKRVVPVLPSALRDRYDESIVLVRMLLETVLAPTGALANHHAAVVQWFYTPMPVAAMLGAFGETVTVYDCMDELAQFRLAPPDISRRERLLLARADVVFTGGSLLYESKSRLHDNVHFYGCGVDVAHFARARHTKTRIPPDVAAIARPILGYFGVVDERLDYELLRRIAVGHPDWSLVLIGPCAKVDPDELPRGANIHWLGQRAYADLPAYVRAFDVCLMPFALNEATEFINPTKTLEYMAAGKPIVSTAVPDVVRNFAPVVRIAPSPEEFIALCAESLARPDGERLGAGLQRAVQASWERIVERMQEHIAFALTAKAAESHALSTTRPPRFVASTESGSDAPELG